MDLTERQVRERAYFIWENEGRVFGRAETHWLRAEAELRGRTASVRIEAAAVETAPAPSPAELLKPRASRTKAAVKVALTDAATTAKPAAKPASKPAAKKAGSKTATAASKETASKAKPRTPRAGAAVAVSLH